MPARLLGTYICTFGASNKSPLHQATKRLFSLSSACLRTHHPSIIKSAHFSQVRVHAVAPGQGPWLILIPPSSVCPSLVKSFLLLSPPPTSPLNSFLTCWSLLGPVFFSLPGVDAASPPASHPSCSLALLHTFSRSPCPATTLLHLRQRPPAWGGLRFGLLCSTNASPPALLGATLRRSGAEASWPEPSLSADAAILFKRAGHSLPASHIPASCRPAADASKGKQLIFS